MSGSFVRFMWLVLSLLGLEVSMAQACPREPGAGLHQTRQANGKPAQAAVNINQADAEALQQALSGVGAAKARAIVAWRQQHGPFRRIEDLAEVKGIGPALLSRNRDRLRLE